MRTVRISLDWLPEMNAEYFLEALQNLAESDETFDFQVVTNMADITFVNLGVYMSASDSHVMDDTGVWPQHVVVLHTGTGVANSAKFLQNHPRVLAFLPAPDSSEMAKEHLFRLASRVAWAS